MNDLSKLLAPYNAVLLIRSVGSSHTICILNRRTDEVLLRVDSVTIENERAAVYDEFMSPLQLEDLAKIAVARFLGAAKTK